MAIPLFPIQHAHVKLVYNAYQTTKLITEFVKNKV